MEKKYIELIMELVREFKNVLPEETEKKELIDSFEKYLYEIVEQIQKSEYENIENKEEFVESVLKSETKSIIELTLENKKQKLINDEPFNQIQLISSKAFEMAYNTIEGQKVEIDEKSLNDLQEKLVQNLKKVRDFNKMQSEILVSEGILDLNFIKEPQIETTSLRLSRYIVRKK